MSNSGLKALPDNFEPQWAALFALLQNALEPVNLKWKTCSRRLEHWTDCKGEQQPALFLQQQDEVIKKRIGQIPEWTLFGMVWIYVTAPDDKNISTGQVMNPYLGAVRYAFRPDATGLGRAQFKNTLGGLVFDAYIEGKIETDEGFLGQQGVAKIPVRMIVNGQ